MNRIILTCFLVLSTLSPLTSAEKPNIIFLLTDDQTVTAAGCYGNKYIITPHLDKLASEGTRFQHYYNTTAICMASRASIMTGLYEYRHGCNFSHGDLPRITFDHSYPLKLRKAGYFTGFAGKVGFVIKGEPFDQLANDFDDWAGGPDQTHYETAKNKGIARYAEKYPHCSRAYGAWAQDFMKKAKQSGKPFCMSISFKAPHLPFTPDPIDLKLYESIRTFPRPANYGPDNGKHLSAQVHTSRAATGYREWVTDYDGSLRRYYALITGVDAALGMIREELQRQGLSDNTVIIYTSDNGYNCGAHGFGDKVLPYEEASKSPLIIHDPRLGQQHRGKTSGAIVGNVDLFPTICSLAGIDVPTGIDGKNLLPLLTTPEGKVRDWLPLFNFWGTPSAQSMAVVSPEWKYIHWYYGGEHMRPTEELFHIGADPIEMHNLAMKSPDVLQAARAAYDAEILAMKSSVIPTHGYSPYPVLFDRNIAWSEKAARSKSQKKSAKPAKKN